MRTKSALTASAAGNWASPCWRCWPAGWEWQRRCRLATHELFDAADGDLQPCVRVESEMLNGGVLGAVEVTVEPDVRSFKVIVGSNTYTLVDGALVLETPPR